MQWFWSLDWEKYFVPEMTLPEILIWGTLLYLSLTILMRLVPKRQAGSASISDILFVVLVGGLTVEGLGKHGKGLPDFVLLLSVVMSLSYLVEWLTYRSPWVRRLLEDEPTQLIRDGQVLKKSLEKEMLSEEELRAQLRLHEVEDPSQVKDARLESEGDISVIKKEDQEQDGQQHDRAPAAECNGKSENAKPLNGHPRREVLNRLPRREEDECEADAAVEEFLAASRRLQEAMDWHRQQAEGHQSKAAELKRLLARHGVRPPARSRAKSD